MLLHAGARDNRTGLARQKLWLLGLELSRPRSGPVGWTWPARGKTGQGMLLWADVLLEEKQASEGACCWGQGSMACWPDLGLTGPNLGPILWACKKVKNKIGPNKVIIKN